MRFSKRRIQRQGFGRCRFGFRTAFSRCRRPGLDCCAFRCIAEGCVKREYLNNIMRGMKVDSRTLSDVAPTLTDLKKLPIEQKCRLLLARLAKIGLHDSALNKHNLMMPGDPYALAYGYADAEKTPVREHLLGAPWTRLVNEGYLVDLTGQGFYKVTKEGKEYLAQEELPAPSPTSPKIPTATTG